MESVTKDTDKQINSLLEQAYSCRIHNLKQSTQLAREALLLSRLLNNKSLIGKCLNQLALYAMIQGEHESSMQMSQQAIKYFDELDDDKGRADAKYNIAGIYYKTDNYHLGLVYLVECLTVYRKYDDYHNQARAEKSLGTIYEYFGDQKNAIRSYENSIIAAKQAGDKNLESNAYNPLSGAYLKQNNFTRALELIELAIAMKEETGDTRGLAFSLYGRAKIHCRKREFGKAESDFKRAIIIHLEMGEKLGLGMAYCKMGDMYIEMGELDKAQAILYSGLELSTQYNIVIIKFKCNHHLYRIHRLANNTVKALEYLERYLEQKEAVINTQTLKVIENYELIAKMEALENEARVKAEKAEIIEKKNRAEQVALVKQEFLSTMSHEIRTPLNAVITIASLLGERVDHADQQLVDSLKFGANNLLLIINDILDFTKLDAGKANLELRAGNFRQLFTNIKNTYESLAKEKGLDLCLNIGQDVAECYELDETKLSQIVGNLITNSIKFSDRGQVSVKISKLNGGEENDLIRFEISDTGTGISEDHLESIFDSFSQPRSITTRKEGGSGLGLAIVKKLVELHNSTIEVSSELGVGSVFYFDVMLKKAIIPVKEAAKNTDQLKDMTVLLAEDNKINAMVAMKLLSNWKMKADHANNGLEAFEKSKLKNYDFILMDIHMPEMDGFEAAKSIRDFKGNNSTTPIFALTADITAENQEEYVDYFNGFLRKPIEINKLFDALVTAL